MAFKDEARFYKIGGHEYPSVTTILQVLNKPALVHWAANQERKFFETAMLEIASQYPVIQADHLLEKVIEAVTGVKAAEKEKQKAATIGKAAHARIEWRTRKLLGEDPGPEPLIPDAAELAVMAWEDWAKEVEFTPLSTERSVYCASCGYAGTLDFVAKVRGVVTLGDYKTGKAIYPESWLQNRAYRHAAKQQGLPSEAGVVLRLPKTLEDPSFESQWVPETDLGDFLAVFQAWRWQRKMEGKTTGSMRKEVAR